MALDSFKLVRWRDLLFTIGIGAVVAFTCYLINQRLHVWLGLGLLQYSRYVSPVIEETLKGAYLIYLLRSRRVGFTVDAAIYGFALGAGFAFVENLYYLRAAMSAGILTWIVRGLGTAIMHGGAMAICGMVARAMLDRSSSERATIYLPALSLAIILHSLFNHFLLPPVPMTIVVLVTFPLLITAVFYRSEQSTQNWLGTGLDRDLELLDLIGSGTISHSPIGIYLENLRNRFPETVVVDMLCLLRLHVELSACAKGLLLMRKAGLEPSPDPEFQERFEELKFLENNIGPTGKLAMMPFLTITSRELWQIHMLGQLSGK